MKTNIALTGFMGAGKSTVAGLLAEGLGKRVIEMDRLIEERAGKSIAEIFSQQGEAAFRRLEMELAVEIAERDNQVISCGGGIVLNAVNIEKLKEKGIIVYLKAAPRELHSRIMDKQIDRPLLKDDRSLRMISDMMAVRQPLYENAADIIIDTSDLNAGETAELITERLKEYEGYS